MLPMPLDSARTYFNVVISSYVIFERDRKILLSLRQNTGYGDGEYSLPAGHIEKGEFATAAAIREAQEESGAVIKPDDLTPTHIMHRHCGDHERIDFFFTAKVWDGEITNTEPDKCVELRWFPFDQLPTNTIPYIQAALNHHRGGSFFSEFIERDHTIFSQ